MVPAGVFILYGGLLVCGLSSTTASRIQIIEAELGKDVVLDCRGPSSYINLVVWVKADLGSEEYIFFFDGKTPPGSKQLPSYQDRVFLQDPQMKNGNAAVLLKNVTNNDTGLYECLVRETKTGQRKRAAGPDEPQSRNKIQLKVTQSEFNPVTDEDSPEAAGLHGHIGLLVAAVMVAVMFTVFVVVWKRSTKKRAEQPAADGEHEEEKLSVV